MLGKRAKELRLLSSLQRKVEALEKDALRREQVGDSLREGLLQLQMDLAASLPEGKYRRPYIAEREEGRGDRRMMHHMSGNPWPERDEVK